MRVGSDPSREERVHFEMGTHPAGTSSIKTYTSGKGRAADRHKQWRGFALKNASAPMSESTSEARVSRREGRRDGQECRGLLPRRGRPETKGCGLAMAVDGGPGPMRLECFTLGLRICRYERMSTSPKRQRGFPRLPRWRFGLVALACATCVLAAQARDSVCRSRAKLKPARRAVPPGDRRRVPASWRRGGQGRVR
jgi:hypothetical protein